MPTIPHSDTVDPATTITIVSGLPRSGTSLMMQMLSAGGLAVTSDGVRVADVHNPRGYFEDERVKTLRGDASWLTGARGTAIKVVAPLLPFLPVDLHYRVLWMERDLDEVLASQQRMLEDAPPGSAAIDEALLRRAFESQLERAREDLRRRRIPRLPIAHRDAISQPRRTAERVAEFVGVGLDISAAASVVEADLHRRRT